MRSFSRRLVVAAALVAAAAGSVAVRPVSAQVSERGAADRPRRTFASVLGNGGVGVDPLERALEEDRARIRPFLGRVARPLTMLSKPEGIDLDVTYIQMTPLYHAYCLDYSIDGLPRPCAGTENDKRWPDRGEPVTFTAHYMNKGTVASGSFQYAWAIDGVEVARGVFPGLQPGTGSVAVYVWPWGHDVVNGQLLGQHTVRFTLDPDNEIAETTKSNNALEDRTDATPLGFQITPEVYQALETPVDPTLPFSAEDWVQKQFHAMNDAFARSVYPSAPDGCEERVRLDQFRITSRQVANDDGIGGWFLSVDDRFNGSVNPDTDIDVAMIHELAHQLGMIDLYDLDYPVYWPHRVLDRNDRPALMEFSSAYLPGLMSAGDLTSPQFDEHSTLGMNRNKGYRRGYYGEYQYDVPEVTRISVLDNRGLPAPGTTVRLFPIKQYGFDPVRGDAAAQMTVETDGQGFAALPNRAAPQLTTLTGHSEVANPFGRIDVVGNNLFLVEISKGTHQEYSWLDIPDLNLLTWRGGSTLEFASRVPPDGAPLPPGSLTGTNEYETANLVWSPSSTPAIKGYNVYRTRGPRGTWTKIAETIPGMRYSDGLDQWEVGYAVTALGADGKESGFSEIFWTIRLDTPTGLTVGPDNVRYERQFQGVASQGADGRYLRFVHWGAPDFGHIAAEPDGHLVVALRNNDTVDVVDPTGDPGSNVELNLGGSGSGPGQFTTPSGVAVMGDPFAWGGPYVLDGQTALLCHFDGTTTSDNGVPGRGQGVPFVTGRFGQGILVQGGAALSYPVPRPFAGREGAVEFWLKPIWGGDDRTTHVLLDAGLQWGDGVRMEKDGAANLRVLAWRGGEECGVGFNVAGWSANEWHHLGITWIGAELSLFVDGRVVARATNCGLPPSLSAPLRIGSAPDGEAAADAVIDEFRLSTTARIGNSDMADRIVVADGGGNRLEVFSRFGDFVGAYGGAGTAVGQFSSPAGVASDGGGRIAVVDAGNSRLQLFQFDGTTFTFIREIAADLLNPDGVAFRGDRIVVADAGHNQVKVFSDTGAPIAVYDGPNDGTYTGAFSGPRDVAIDNNGHIVVADTGNNRVVEVIHSEPHNVRRKLHGRP